MVELLGVWVSTHSRRYGFQITPPRAIREGFSFRGLMPWYMTDYRANWRGQDADEKSCSVGAYGGHLWARSMRAAKRIAEARGLGERVVSRGFIKDPYKVASEMFRSKAPFEEKIHALCYLGMIAIASGVATPQEIIGDEGIVHKACHRRDKKTLLARIEEIERRVPGYLYGGKDGRYGSRLRKAGHAGANRRAA